MLRVEPELKPANVAVVGCGHLGLVMAAGFAELGHQVVGVDRNPTLVDQICRGDIPFHEQDLPELVARGLGSGRLTFTTSYAAAIPQADYVFLTVDTPPTVGGAADLRSVRAAATSIAGALDGKTPVVVNKSTSPVGTAETIGGILARAAGPQRVTPRVVSNPEFLRQGHGVHDFFNPDRIVIGGAADDARAVAELYRGLPGEVILTDLRTAEMIKYVANSFLATRVSFINEIARLCEAVGVDVDRVVAGIAPDPRIGRHMFNAGIGFGGSCLPKDVAALRYVGDQHGAPTPLLQSVAAVNDGQRTGAVRRLRAALGGTLEQKVIAAWGVTFKANTEDARESPAVEVITLLMNEGAIVRAYDPSAPTSAPGAIQALYQPTALEAVRGADALAVLTDWPEFRQVPLAEVKALMRGAVVFDGRNVLGRADAAQAGLRYVGVGRPATEPE